jgi:hypothetical protein
MARQRPAVLTVMGILNLVFGSLGLLCGLCGGIGFLFILGGAGQGGAGFGGGPNPFAAEADKWRFMSQEIPAFPAVRIGELVVGFLFSTCLIVSGIGLLNMRGWGRVLALLYSLFTILLTLGSLIFTLAVVNPVQQRWILDFRRRNPGAPTNDLLTDPTLVNILTVVGAVLSMIYAIVLLITMLLPSVSAAVAGRSPAADYDLDRGEDDDDLGRERRRRQEWNE